MPIRLVFIAVVCLVAAVVRAGGPGGGDSFADDPSVVTGRLDNGVGYVTMQRDGEDAAVWLVIDAGSLGEPTGRAGLAALTQRMVLQGAGDFRPGEIERTFDPTDSWSGRPEHAVVGYDRSVFTLTVPAADEASIGVALRFCAGALTSVRFDGAVFERERKRSIERLKPMEGAALNAQRGLLEALAPGLGDRWPGGSGAGLAACSLEDAIAFWRAWYRPDRATVIVVGPRDAGELARRVRAAMEGVSARGAATTHEFGEVRTNGRTGASIEAPGLARSGVALARVEPEARGALTPEGWRDRVLDDLAVAAARAQLEEARAGGALPGFETQADAEAVRGLGRIVHLGLVGSPGDEAAMVRGLRAQSDSIGAGHLSASAIANGRASVSSEARRRIARVDDAPAAARRLEQALKQGTPLVTPARELALTEEALKSIGDGEVAARAGELFAMDDAVIAVQHPGTFKGTGDDLVRLAGEGGAIEAGAAPAPDLLAALGANGGGRVAELAHHTSTGVTSAWLANGVRVYHRRMDAGRVEVRVVLAGGAIEEGSEERGLTKAAASAMVSSGLGSLDSQQAARALAAAGVTVSSEARDDEVQIAISGASDRVREALVVAGEVVRGARADDDAVERWRAQQRSQVAADLANAAQVAGRTLDGAWMPANARPLTIEEIDKVSAVRVRAWAAHLAAAPMSVSVVGDVGWDEAIDAAAGELGSLAVRPRVSAALFSRHAGLPELAPMTEVKGEVHGGSVAAVAWGFTGPSLDELADARAMNAAAVVLGQRLSERLERGEPAVSGVWAWYHVDAAYPGRSHLSVLALTDPARAGEVRARIESIAESFAAEGPTSDEMEAVRRHHREVVAQSLANPGFWSRRLADADLRGRSLDDFATMARDYDSQTGEEVGRVFGEAAMRGARYRVIVTPAE